MRGTQRGWAGHKESAPKEGRQGMYMYDVHVYLKVLCYERQDLVRDGHRSADRTTRAQCYSLAWILDEGNDCDGQVQRAKGQ